MLVNSLMVVAEKPIEKNGDLPASHVSLPDKKSMMTGQADKRPPLTYLEDGLPVDVSPLYPRFKGIPPLGWARA